jgi:hypothetical protein
VRDLNTLPVGVQIRELLMPRIYSEAEKEAGQKQVP